MDKEIKLYNLVIRFDNTDKIISILDGGLKVIDHLTKIYCDAQDLINGIITNYDSKTKSFKNELEVFNDFITINDESIEELDKANKKYNLYSKTAFVNTKPEKGKTTYFNKVLYKKDNDMLKFNNYVLNSIINDEEFQNDYLEQYVKEIFLTPLNKKIMYSYDKSLHQYKNIEYLETHNHQDELYISKLKELNKSIYDKPSYIIHDDIRYIMLRVGYLNIKEFLKDTEIYHEINNPNYPQFQRHEPTIKIEKQTENVIPIEEDTQLTMDIPGINKRAM